MGLHCLFCFIRNFSVQGIKGASPMLSLKYVNLTKVFPVDWMHCVLLGVSKYMMNLWFGHANKNRNFHIGENVSIFLYCIIPYYSILIGM
jgi:hypothetical protein